MYCKWQQQRSAWEYTHTHAHTHLRLREAAVVRQRRFLVKQRGLIASLCSAGRQEGWGKGESESVCMCASVCRIPCTHAHTHTCTTCNGSNTHPSCNCASRSTFGSSFCGARHQSECNGHTCCTAHTTQHTPQHTRHTPHTTQPVPDLQCLEVVGGDAFAGRWTVAPRAPAAALHVRALAGTRQRLMTERGWR